MKMGSVVSIYHGMWISVYKFGKFLFSKQEPRWCPYRPVH
jgi:hypothetical protein